MRQGKGLPREIRFLARMQCFWDDRAVEAEGLDWAGMLLLARRHRVVPGLAAGVARTGLEVPASVLATLRTSLTQAAMEELALAATTRTLVEKLGEAGLQPAVLKGVPLSLMIHGRLGLRYSRDIDLLIPPAAAGAAAEILEREGFRPAKSRAGDHADLHKDIEFVNDRTRQIVELHTRLFDNPHLMPLGSEIPLVWTELPSGVNCFVLQERANLLYLAIHGAQHGWSRLKWIADLAPLLQAMGDEGRERFYAGLSHVEGRRAVGQALLLCHDLFDMPLPPTLVADRTKDRRLAWMHGMALHSICRSADREIEDIPFGSTVKNLSHYLIRSDWPYLAAELRHDLAPPAADNAAPRLSSLGPVGRLLSWLARHRRLGRHRSGV